MDEFPKAFQPEIIEQEWYRFWEENQLFKADASSSKPPFCIVIPPPNVTGVLHMGHALVDTLQDVLIRYKRMQGFETLWVPGTDHAGIATQAVVERNLIKQYNKRRSDFSREEFLSHVWQWKEKSEKEILKQIRQIGCSCDWSRLRFTMDEGCNKAVRILFKKLYDQGLMYKGDYLVNWDPVTLTALADDEVEYEEKESFLWFLRYPVEGGGFITVATTRPETMLGDVAVAVNEKDERYTDMIGKTVLHPFTGRKIPIIADHFVKPEFGTGAVKITPAHDHNDYEMALRCNLPMINIMTPDGRINENGGAYEGLPMAEARIKIVADLKGLHLLDRIEPHMHRVGLSYRSKAVIEPYLSKQWFMKMSAFKEKLKEIIREEKVKLVPKEWEKTYFHWIDNLRDWCVSRQLWWGHQIPIWYRVDDPSHVICYDGEGVPPEVQKNPADYVQDPDVLDTWFSAALWPLSTLGWPEKTPDFKKFYPTSTLITGHDILFFWVARMIMVGDYLTGMPPFHESFLHGLIYAKSYWKVDHEGMIHYVPEQERKEYDLGKSIPLDVQSKWEKMSKSKGNIIDPLEIVASYGADAMRMALCSSATHARQIDLDRRRFEDYKNFANKVWNGARFMFMNIEDLTAEELAEGVDPSLFTLEDKWILSTLSRTIQEIDRYLEQYAFNFAAELSYNFYWKEFCAYYLECIKPALYAKEGALRKNKQKLLVILLTAAIRLLHPMAPFITEELFQRLKTKFPMLQQNRNADPFTKECVAALQSKACIVAAYPKVVSSDAINAEVEAEFQYINDVVYAIRNIRAEMQIPPGYAIDLYIDVSPNTKEFQILQEHGHLLKALVKIQSIAFNAKQKESEFFSSTLLKEARLTIPLPQEMREKEKIRLAKEEQKLIEQVNRFQAQLGNEGFTSRAPKEIIEKLQMSLEQTQKELLDVAKKLQSF